MRTAAWTHTHTHCIEKPGFVFNTHLACANPRCSPTGTEISTRAASVSLQQHTLRGHLRTKSSLDVVNKVLAVRTVNPDSFSQRILDVYLTTELSLKESSNKSRINSNQVDSYFNKYFWPVLVLLVGCHQQIASKNRHQAVTLGFKVDWSIPTQEAAQSLERNQNI